MKTRRRPGAVDERQPHAALDPAPRECVPAHGDDAAVDDVLVNPQPPHRCEVYRRVMSDTSNGSDAINSTGSQQGGSVTTDAIDTGLSDDIQSSLTAQGVSDRETVDDIREAEGDKKV